MPRADEIARRIRHIAALLQAEGFRLDSSDPEVKAILLDLQASCPFTVEGLRHAADEIEGT